MIILDGSLRVRYSVVLIVLEVAEPFGVAADVLFDTVPIAMNRLVIDVEVIHVARLNRLLLLKHRIIWVFLLTLVNLDLALSELGPRPVFQLFIKVGLRLLLSLKV